MKVMQNFTMRPNRSRGVLAVLFVLVSLLAGCSLVRFGYNNGETLTYWWLNGYVDFDSDQQPWVKKQIDQLFVWHRKTQLRDYSQLLARAQNQLSHPVTPADTQAFYDELKKRAWVLVEQALPSLADLALSLNPQQIAHIEQKFAANNDEYRKDHLHRDIDRRQESRYKKIMQQAEYWFGDFSDDQEALIRKTSDARPLNNEIWMQERLRRQREMLAMLKKIQAEKPSREATIVMLRQYAQSVFEPGPHVEHQSFIDASREAGTNLAAVIINNTTPEQKAHAMKRLQKWIDTFHTLAAKSS